MKWLKAAGVGAIAALVMLLIMKILIAMGVAPFRMTPSAAFLTAFDVPAMPLALVIHFGYAIVWSALFVAAFAQSARLLGKGLGLGVMLWVIMMLVASPLIGWGLFGVANTGDLPPGLQLASTLKYVIVTLVLHLIYGGIVGWLNPLWIGIGPTPQQAGQPAAS